MIACNDYCSLSQFECLISHLVTGISRWLKGSSRIGKSMIVANLYFPSTSAKKVIKLFPLFMLRLENKQKSSRTLFTMATDFSIALQKMLTWFAKAKWFSTRVPLELNTSKFPCATPSYRGRLRISKTIMNSMGESRSPYLIPHVALKILVGDPSTNAERDVDLMQARMIFLKIWSNPIASIVAMIESHLIVSNPLEKSIEIDALWQCDFLLKPFINSWHGPMFSLIFQPLRIAVWLGEISDGRTSANLVVSTLFQKKIV